MNSATRVVVASHQRVRSLEQLQELALSAWQREAHRKERRTMDTLATTTLYETKD